MYRFVRFIRPSIHRFAMAGYVGSRRKGLPSSVLPSGTFHRSKPQWIIALTVLQWLGFEKDDETQKSDLIMMLKRAVLCVQRQEFDKAEQMLHLALRLAQQQQNTQGVMYCYDLMANLAFDTLHLEKAEKIFVDLMRMLLASGVQQEDNKMIHISLKVARINHLLAKSETAATGYKWCIDKIRPRKDEDYDAKMLYGVVLDWYAQFLLDHGHVADALEHLRDAHHICKEIGQQNTEQEMLLLNDLGTTSWRAGDRVSAEVFFKEALAVGETIKEQQFVGVVFANLGLIQLQNGLLDVAKENCTRGWKIGQTHNNNESIGQSTYCLGQIKDYMDEQQKKRHAE